MLTDVVRLSVKGVKLHLKYQLKWIEMQVVSHLLPNAEKRIYKQRSVYRNKQLKPNYVVAPFQSN